MTAPTLALRDAIRGVLLANPDVAALVGDRIHDWVPSQRDGLVLPFLAFGPMRRERMETGDDPASPVKIRLYTASDAYERDQAWEVAEAVADAIEGEVLEIDGPFACAMELRVTMIGDAIETGLPRDVFLDVATVVYRAA